MQRTTPKRKTHKHSQKGYVLLTLLLFMALLIIAAGTAASSLAFTIRRDREEELIHRGAQYRRAIREFTRKTGRFPVRLEELDNTDGRRYLRKHYKDPTTGQDFKLVHMADIQLAGTSQIPGLKTVSDANSSDAAESSVDSQKQDQSDPAATDPNHAAQGTPRPSMQATSVPSPQQPISGGLIVGVVSASKEKTIREFNRKNHYNQWRFYYDTAFDRNYLINAPTERSLFQPNGIAANLNGNPQAAVPQTQPPANDTSLSH